MLISTAKVQWPSCVEHKTGTSHFTRKGIVCHALSFSTLNKGMSEVNFYLLLLGGN